MADLMQNGMDTPTRKESNCVRCRNHGLKVTLRGHKQYCPYAACSCDKCRFTAEQQRQMRLQNAIRRAEASDRGSGVSVAKRARELSSPPTMVPLPHQPQPQQQNQHISSTQQPQIVTVTVQTAPSQQIVASNGISGITCIPILDFEDYKSVLLQTKRKCYLIAALSFWKSFDFRGKLCRSCMRLQNMLMATWRSCCKKSMRVMSPLMIKL